MNKAAKILKRVSLDKTSVAESRPMTTTNMTTEQTLKTVLKAVFTKSVTEQKSQLTDISRMNNACLPYIQEQMKQGSNIKWTISEIQNKMKNLVEYAPKSKEENNPPFEMRVLASAEQLVLVVEGVNPNAFGQYDKDGTWIDHPKTAKTIDTKNYNVKFNDFTNGFSFDKDGNLQIANKYIKPVIENEVKVSDTVTKKEKFVNQTDTKQQVSKAIATSFFNRAYPQAKKTRATKPLTENEQIQNAEKLTKYVKDINVVYAEYVKLGGKSGNAERLLEKDAKILMTLKDEINTMLTTRGNSEDLAFEIEQGQRQAG